MDKLDLQTPDFTSANIERISALFPNCVTETRTADGTVRRAIDFDLLRQELSAEVVDGPCERYRLDWPGKREALALANAPIRKTLRPCREESVDFDHTGHLYIEGDNLDALKLLQETYLGKVKMIYIDPPYNTGNDFIYDDNFSMSRSQYLERSGDVDEEGRAMFDEEKWKQNSSRNGRFHSEWLSMMYTRIKLARNLLSDDGVIFISIDDGEVGNLRKICDEIFSESNFLANIVWEKSYAPRNNAPAFSNSHDHVLCYAKSNRNGIIGKLDPSPEQRGRYTNRDNDPRGDWKAGDMTVSLVSGQRGRTYQKTGKGANLFAVKSPSGKTFFPPAGRSWVYGEEKFMRLIDDNRVWWGDSGDSMPSLKRFWNEIDGKQVCQTIWKYTDVGHNQEASKELKALFSEQNSAAFSTPKPIRLIERMLRLSTSSGDLILDFFSGSASTAHAVMQINAEDGEKRRHIMVQIPEPCDEAGEAFKAGFNTIAEIGKERIRRAGKQIRMELEEKLGKEKKGTEEYQTLKIRLDSLDTGFRVLKIDNSNMADVYYQPDDLTQGTLSLHVDNLKPGRSPEDLLFQVLLDWGVDFALPVTEEKILKRRVFFVADNALVACFDTGLDEAFVKELAKRQPLRAVFRDSSYANDAVKINFEQIFKALSPHTELKTL